MEDDRRPRIRIGVMVPASGRLETFGREVRQGAALALETLAAPPFPFRIEAVPIDERDGDGALVALKEALAAEDIVVLIGPLASNTVERIMGEAERSSLAVFSPTACSPRLAGGSLNFFRNCLTLEKFGAELAEFAVEVLGVRTFVTFAPDDAYGLRYGEIFQEEVARLGGAVLALESYDRSLTDFAKPIQALKKTIGMPDPLPEPVEGKEEESYRLPFDGIFLPGYAEQVGLVVPQLAFHEIDVRHLTVLGANGLNSPRFPETGEEFAEGAFFIDGFFAGSPREQVRRFTALYREEYGEDPGTFAVQAYDAVAIVLDQLRRGAVTRKGMLSALEGVHAFPGVAGPTTLHPGGWVEREPFFGMVFKGHLVSVSASPREGGVDSGVLEVPAEQVPAGKFP
jgi:ABC-type branched-subunit amino acid transport system substrate-binding protein